MLSFCEIYSQLGRKREEDGNMSLELTCLHELLVRLDRPRRLWSTEWRPKAWVVFVALRALLRVRVG